MAKACRTGISPGQSGWDKVRGKVLDSSRPFFVYPWKQSLRIDAMVLISMISFPLFMGLPISLMKFEPDTDNSVDNHKLYMYAGMSMLGLTTGLNPKLFYQA